MKNITRKKILTIGHPAGVTNRRSVWPIFLPFAGCRQKCIFCAQNLTTGRGKVGDYKSLVVRELERLQIQSQKRGKIYGLGFFGGTFTGLDLELQDWILTKVEALKKQGIINFVCLSTRPDYITPEVVSLLSNKVDLVELGVQSFDTSVLLASFRGYSREVIFQAVELLNKYQLKFGFQLLPGLPKHSLELFYKDIELTISLKPATLRIYPCLVLKGTSLARLYKQGVYQPWSLRTTIEALGKAVLKIWQAKIQILRIGLTPEPSLISNILAGPWHAALGFLAKSLALNTYLHSIVNRLDWTPREILVPVRYAAEFFGYKNQYKPFWQNLNNISVCIKIGNFEQFIFC
ncbi:MAG: radical SAM protein [Desulfonauticus sp.]|nr:radical SAM protein [Desulfonauticus sp.]